jgi:hypothetical protein
VISVTAFIVANKKTPAKASGHL